MGGSSSINNMVSVIVPFFNNINWLEEAIESVLNQTYKNFEIIVINDGSKECIDKFLEKYNNYIIYKFQENKGAGSARNLAIKHAKGDYIAFLDSDDIWLPCKLEKQILFMQKTGAFWSHTGYYYWNPETNYLKTVNVKREYGNIYKKTFVSVRVATPCVVLRTSIIKDNPQLTFHESYRIGQDTKLWQDISQLYPIGLLREPLTKVRLRSDNTHKQYIRVINHKANEYKVRKNNPNTPLLAKITGLMYLSSSQILPNSSSNKIVNTIAKLSMLSPYLLGRAYVNLISISNRNYKNLVK